MLVYLKGSPLPTRKSPFALDIAPQVSESRHLALIKRAGFYHANHIDGLHPAAKKLKVLRHVVQLRATKSGGHVILVWMWLSDDSKSKVAWLLGADEFALYRTWRRVAWSDLRFKQDAVRSQPRRYTNPKPA
jgi:hypothetical protein